MKIVLEDRPSIDVKIEKRTLTAGEFAGKNHIKIWVTFKVRNGVDIRWNQRPYKTGLYCSVEEFERVKDSNVRDNRLPTALLDIRKALRKRQAYATHLIDELKLHKQDAFEMYFLSNHKVESVDLHFEEKINELRTAKPRPKISSAEKYRTALKSLHDFFGPGIVITFDMLTIDNLQAYEDWYVEQTRSETKSKIYELPAMELIDHDDHVPISAVLKQTPIARTTLYRHIREKGMEILTIGPVSFVRKSQLPGEYKIKVDEKQSAMAVYSRCVDKIQEASAPKENRSLTSVGINLRCVRHIYKRVIKKGIVPVTDYPFGIGGYVIPEGGDDTKQFLDHHEKELFKKWRHADDEMNELHDYTLFSYFGFGMNLSDVARLRKTKVFKDYISIDRQKTKGRKKKQKSTVIPMHPVMAEVIARRSRKSLIPDDYVFPILEYGWSEEQIFYRIRTFVDDVNKMLKTLKKETGIETNLTSYTLRHTFAFNYMEQGATTEELQDALAHGSKTTTEAYKHGFTLEKKRKFSEGL